MKQSAHGEKDGTFFETDFSKDRVDSSKNTPIRHVEYRWSLDIVDS